MTEKRPTLLIVDDETVNIDILTGTLDRDYTVRVATDGFSALRIVGKSVPDLILLDVMMPGLDGFEVCRRLKEDPATRDIPVIFVTALTEDTDEARGLALGAADYITKPFSPSLVKARVRNHLDLKAHRDHLAALVAERTLELEKAHNRLRAVDAARQDYLCAISHELRTPLNGALGIAQLALYEIPDEELRAQYTTLFETSRDRLISALDTALQLADFQNGASIRVAPVDPGKILALVLAELNDAFSSRNLAFIAPPPSPRRTLANEVLLRQCVLTLLRTALRMATPGTSVATEMEDVPGGPNRVILRFAFQGPPMSQDLTDSLFETISYARSCSHVQDLGFALPLAAEIVRAMGGSVEIGNTTDGGEIRLTLLGEYGPA